MGIGPKKTWDAITNTAYYADPAWEKWYPLNPVPGTAGRIAAAAASARDNIFLFGGYVVDDRNRGLAVTDVNVYQVGDQHWSRTLDIPLAVGGSVAGVYRDRYIYLIGGLSNAGAVPDVQIYDVEKTKWLKATPTPGMPVFGHAGALLDDTIVYVDGAYQNPSAAQPRYLASDQCWMGKIDHHDPAKIDWSKLPSHPGAARFGIAAGAAEKDRKIYFTGGTDNPDGYTGTGFDGKPAEPSATTFAFNLRSGKWEMVSDKTPDSTMNNRGLLVIPEGLVVVGGIEKGQQVTSRVTLLPLPSKTR
jgi:N-acetylneuraminic acid mutarotase